ncbi:TetR/AcrR family transcriptional regulator [Nonomuraea pusilla]|uniref:TetR/AcrR family transcriptional regulator n=1 Tax=Nonomuraea pusilla TaxID=46177 RepID=UPI003325312D
MGSARDSGTASARRDDGTPRRADAERNIAAIIATGLELFGRSGNVSMADVAKAAGVGRVTLYAHFPSRADLLHALVRHAVEQTGHVIDAGPADPSEPADLTLGRLLAAAWRVLDRYRKLRVHALAELGPEQLDRQHDPIRHRLAAVVARGQEQGVFRTDLPADWMITAVFSLVHAAADEADSGRLAPEAVPDLLRATVLPALANPRTGSTGPASG